MSVAVSPTHVMRKQSVWTLRAATLAPVKWAIQEMERTVQTLMSVPAPITRVIDMQPVSTQIAATFVNV